MKHTFKITFLLLGLFLLSQVVGLSTVNKYIKPEVTAEGELIIVHDDTAIGEQPVVEEKSSSFLWITIAILIGTGILLILVRFKMRRFWKLWFFMSVLITMAVSFGVYVPMAVAWAMAFILGLLKIFKPNPIVHNFTEIFIYTGIAIIILPFLNLVSGILLLAVISIYDMIAVWKSKHMVKLAKFQTEEKLFAGIMINYGKGAHKLDAPDYPGKKEPDGRTAILGGGDIAFPLMFSSAVMEHLILVFKLPKNTAFLETSIISLFAGIALLALFFKAEKGKFYPAMPFLSIGCAIGLAVILAINL